MLLDNKDVDARYLLRKLVKPIETFAEEGHFLFSNAGLLLRLGEAIHVNLEMKLMLIL